MSLEKYDNKCIQVIDSMNNIFEGVCSHNSREYTYHEFGRDEESIQLACFLFYRNDIKEIHSLESHHGIYGHFTEAYGTLEKMIVDDGIDLIDEVLTSEENEHIYRILSCLEDYFHDKKLLEYEKVIPLLNNLVKYNNDEKVKEKAQNLILEWKK